jgi:hypothetical protein
LPLPLLLESVPEDEPVPLYSDEFITELTQQPL